MISSKTRMVWDGEDLKAHPAMDRDSSHRAGSSKSERGDHEESLKTEIRESLKQKKKKKLGKSSKPCRVYLTGSTKTNEKERTKQWHLLAGGMVTAPQDGKQPCWNSSDFQGITGVLCLVCCLPPCFSQTISKHRL